MLFIGIASIGKYGNSGRLPAFVESLRKSTRSAKTPILPEAWETNSLYIAEASVVK